MTLWYLWDRNITASPLPMSAFLIDPPGSGIANSPPWKSTPGAESM
eukprot:CAMPEP_0113993506 /NCGR_PEP_ID=MMETSP0328-20130328/10179_1 /TAXON_ID=39455 /ORGANISM="Alexandrium minutum" /LENGTH=45 /assembly_acc=CAM_ASM_000350